MVSSFQSISTSVKSSAVILLFVWSYFLQFKTFLLPVYVLANHRGALLPSQMTFLTHRFLFSPVLCCLSLISNVPTIVIFLMAAYPFHIPFLSLCLKISMIPPSYKELNHAACRLLMCFIKCSCFPNKWWYYYRLISWTELWDQMWCFHLVNFVRICVVLEARAWLGLTCSSWVCWH